MKRILSSLLVLACASAYGNGKIDAQGEYRVGVEKDGQFNNSCWLYETKCQARFGGVRPAFSEGVGRVSLGYRIRKGFSVWAGYDFRPEIPNGTSSFVFEHRVWQQAIIRLSERVIWRARIEQRYFNLDGQIAWRFRERLTGQILPRTHCRPGVFISNELYFNLNHPEWVSNKVVDQNRLRIYAVFTMPCNTKMQVGYLNSYRFREPIDRMTHSLLTTWYF